MKEMEKLCNYLKNCKKAELLNQQIMELEEDVKNYSKVLEFADSVGLSKAFVTFTEEMLHRSRTALKTAEIEYLEAQIAIAKFELDRELAE